MSICPRRVCVITVACLGFLLAGSPAAHALVLSWDSVAWAPGSQNNSYDLNGDSVNDITVSMTAANNTFTNDPTTGMMTPAINQTLTGGQSPVQNTLMLAGNLFTHSDMTIHLSFTGTQNWAQNVAFSIFDIDVATNSDIISGIYGVAPDGTHIAATITNIGSAITPSGAGLSQMLTGNVPSADSGPGSSNGNATISFGSTVITDVFFTFSNTAGAPRYQDIALGDISFTPVPEINPAATSAISCLLAIGLTTLVHRRARLRARRLRAAQS
jgi:hypothetical protein